MRNFVRNSNIKFFMQTLIICLLSKLLITENLQASDNNLHVSNLSWIKWNLEDSWLPFDFGRPGPVIIANYEGARVRASNVRASGAHPYYDYKGLAQPHPADRIRYQVSDCIIQLQFKENDIYKNGETRIKGEQIDYVQKSKAIPSSKLKDLGLLNSCYERLGFIYDELAFNHNNSLETFELAEIELANFAKNKLSAIDGFEIHYFDDIGLKFSDELNIDNGKFEVRKPKAGIIGFFITPINPDVAKGVKRVEVVTILNRLAPLKMRTSCASGEKVELDNEKFEILNKRIVVDAIKNQSSIVTYAKPNGAKCSGFNVGSGEYREKLILVGQTENWLLIGTRRSGYGWVEKANFRYSPVCFHPTIGNWVTSDQLQGTNCKLD